MSDEVPTVSISYSDMCCLVGKTVPMEQLKDSLFLLKCEVEAFSDDELMVEVTSDRPDLLSTEGMAREMRGFLGFEKGLISYSVGRSDVVLRVDPSVRSIRPFISSALLRDVTLSDEAVRQIMQLQEKLHLTYCRNRRKVSIGVHDIDKVAHNITYAGMEPEKISFVPLDETREMNGNEILKLTSKGREYAFILEGLPKYPLLFDENGSILSMPPIINGTVTTVTPETKNLLLDVTGTDERLVESVLNIMCTDLAERSARIEDVKIICDRKAFRRPILRPNRMSVSTRFINRTLGLELTSAEVASSLKRMRYGASGLGSRKLSVLVPPYRTDILHELDIVEDVAIGYGYDRLVPEVPLTATIGRELPVTSFTRKVRDLMIGLGFLEVLSYVMTSDKNLFEQMNLGKDRVVEIANPMTTEFSSLRNWLLPGLLMFLGSNKHVPYPQRIFECGDIVLVDDTKPTRTRTKRKMAAALCDHVASFEDILGPLYAFLENMGAKECRAEEVEHLTFIQGRVASIRVRSENVAVAGEIHPQVLSNFHIQNPVCAFEVDLEKTMQLLSS